MIDAAHTLAFQWDGEVIRKPASANPVLQGARNILRAGLGTLVEGSSHV